MNERIRNELINVKLNREKRKEDPLEYIKELEAKNETYQHFYKTALEVADKRLDKIKRLKKELKFINKK